VRIDDYLSTVFLIKRRTVAKEWISSGKVRLNGSSVKPPHKVKLEDLVEISYPHSVVTIKVTDIPHKSIAKDDAEKYYKLINTL